VVAQYTGGALGHTIETYAHTRRPRDTGTALNPYGEVIVKRIYGVTAWIPLLLCAQAPAEAETVEVKIEATFYRPDVVPPVMWLEGNSAMIAKGNFGYSPAGSVHALVRNAATSPITVTNVLIDGESARALREKRQVVWWRTQPNPVPPGALGEVTVRFRYPLEKPVKLALAASGKPIAEAVVQQKRVGFRIETIGFRAVPNRMMVYVSKQSEAPVRIAQVRLDGRDVTADARILAPTFFEGCCPIEVPLAAALQVGSVHAVEVIDAAGAEAFHVFRVPPAYTPLGTYGYSNFEQYAANNLNTYVCFGGLSRASLDRLEGLGMRGAFHIGYSDPPQGVRGHPAIAGYLQRDEPDCADYGVTDRPHHERIGHQAQQMVEHAARLFELDPKTVLWQTLDLTYKPANWLHYGLVADVTNTDAYPLVIGVPLTFVRDVVQTARSGCSPRPLTFTFQSGWEEAEHRGWNRPPFADEMRRMMLYAVGSGARGLISYIHCSEKASGWMGHGTNEFPDLWYEVGRTFRSLSGLRDLIRVAHPLRIESGRADRLWVATLLVGPNAMLVVVVNDNYTSKADVFEQTPALNVSLRVPRPPWLDAKRCVRVEDGRARPVEMEVDGRAITLSIDRIEAGDFLVICADAILPDRLESDFQARQARLASALLATQQRSLCEQAKQAAEMRSIPFKYGRYKIAGSVIGGYAIARANFWNPGREQYDVLEYWEGKGTSRKGVVWKVEVPAERAGKAHVLYWMGHVWGTGAAAAKMTLRDSTGKEIASTVVPTFAEGIHRWTVTPPIAGKYTIELIQQHDGEKGARIAKAAYLVPEG
jgi:hypothetical protein